MKNSKIHSGLVNSDLRDFLSISIVKNYEQEFKNKKKFIPYPEEDYTFEYVIKDCENEILFQNRRLQLLKEKQAILTLIKMQGWEEFDVSNETEKDLEYRLSINFIGTQSEYNDFINVLNIER